MSDEYDALVKAAQAICKAEADYMDEQDGDLFKVLDKIPALRMALLVLPKR